MDRLPIEIVPMDRALAPLAAGFSPKTAIEKFFQNSPTRIAVFGLKPFLLLLWKYESDHTGVC